MSIGSIPWDRILDYGIKFGLDSESLDPFLEIIMAMDDAYLEHFIKGAHAVVNLIGILYETRHQKFDDIHHQFPKRLAKLCAKHKVAHFVHVSAMGASQNARAHYALSKAQGEDAIKKHCEDAVIIKPSVIFGAEDNFFNMFAKIAKISPYLPLIGGGKTKFQPVFVGDVARAIRYVIKNASCLQLLPIDNLGEFLPSTYPEITGNVHSSDLGNPTVIITGKAFPVSGSGTVKLCVSIISCIKSAQEFSKFL